MAETPAQPITIKKYANRRLYNTATSSYVTLDSLSHMVKDGVDFVVVDAKTGEDITRSVLTQIIVEEEAKGDHLLPTSFLRQLIGLYGDNISALVPNYLDYTMQAFARNQERMRQTMANAAVFPFTHWEEMGKQNMAMFERALSMISPLNADREDAAVQPNGDGRPAGEDDTAETLETLKAQLAALQQQVDRLSRK